MSQQLLNTAVVSVALEIMESKLFSSLSHILYPILPEPPKTHTFGLSMFPPVLPQGNSVKLSPNVSQTSLYIEVRTTNYHGYLILIPFNPFISVKSDPGTCLGIHCMLGPNPELFH